MEKVISIVGAGGKTTLVHKLAREYHRSGKGVLVSTTPHKYVEADTDLSCDFFALRDKIIKDGYCMAGQKISEQKISEQSKSKMCGLPYDLLDKLIKDMPQALDYVIIEADGAKHHSLKYPAADAVVDDSVIDTLRQVYVRKLRDSGFEGRVSCVFANERGWF